MNKQELIDAIAKRADLPKVQVAKMIAVFGETVTDALKGGDTVTLAGFGTFSVAERAARTGRNPQTGEEIKINASKAPKFKPGKPFKDAVQ